MDMFLVQVSVLGSRLNLSTKTNQVTAPMAGLAVAVNMALTLPDIALVPVPPPSEDGSTCKVLKTLT